MNSHLVTVEIGVEGRTDQRMDPNGLPFDQDRIKSLNAETVKGGRTVQHDRVIANDLVQDIPDFGDFPFHKLLGALDGGYETFFL